MGTVKIASDKRLVIETAYIAKFIQLGASVAVQGVCLTVSAKKNGLLTFGVMPVTFKKTTLGKLKAGDAVNMETSLKIGDEIGGHFVFGHVDAVAKVLNVERDGETVLVTIQPPKSLLRYLVPQGSVAVDGVSLTVAKKSAANFTVSLVSHTAAHTTLGQLMPGSAVNIECDMLAKYAQAR